jgi:hypothetical protein
MELRNKELCGKDTFFLKKKNRFSMYLHDKKIGEVCFNEEGNVYRVYVQSKKHVKNMLYYLDCHKEFVIDDIQGFPCEQKYISAIKDRLSPNILLHYAILANSKTLAREAIQRNANLTKETFVNSAIHSYQIVDMHIKNGLDFVEDAMDAAFNHKNYNSIRSLAKKSKNLEKYIEMCNQKEEYKVIKKYLIKAFVKSKSNER